MSDQFGSSLMMSRPQSLFGRQFSVIQPRGGRDLPLSSGETAGEFVVDNAVAFSESGAQPIALFPSQVGASAPLVFRTIDGSGNNSSNSDWGTPGAQLLRLTYADYDDGISAPRSAGLPSARAVSNAVVAQSGSVLNAAGLSDWFWQWGQFLDHDIDLTESAHPTEAFNINVPQGDALFDPFNTGTQQIDLNRSIYDTTTGTGTENPRQQINEITSFIDGSMVYGSDQDRADALRTDDGRLKTSAGDLLPFNEGGFGNAGGSGSTQFLAGDVRANEQIGLTSVHTLFVREHNRIADGIAQRIDAGDGVVLQKLDTFLAEHPDASEGDFIYESTRKLIGAKIQMITYQEFLPLMLGQELSPYAGYNATVNPGIANEFSTAAFRFGHTMLSPQLQQYDANGNTSTALRNAFFNPTLAQNGGVDSFLVGLGLQQAQEIDSMVIDDVRNFLFGPPGAGGFDLTSLNLQRGRDHGLPGLNDVRSSLGLSAYGSFLELAGGDAALADKYASVYTSVNDVDLWIGGLGEQHVNGGVLGETFSTIVADQFTRLRDGDRFFYANDLESLEWLDPDIQNTTFADILRGNTENAFLVQDNPFMVPYDNSIVGDDLNNTLFGSGKNDLIKGGAGSDFIIGRRGNDLILGEADNDVIRGGLGDDTILGGFGDDFVLGEQGADVLHGGNGNDDLQGGGGNDSILGGLGNDQLFGDNGDDTLVGGAGNDVYNGGAGSDRYIFGNDLLNDGLLDRDTIMDFKATDTFDLTDYRGSVGVTRFGSRVLEVDLNGEDKVMVFGNRSALNGLETQLASHVSSSATV
ncbi:MAG: peroxidase family protein [Thermosynechococcaceae cyanobacterium]